MKTSGKMHYLWRAVDDKGEVLEPHVAKRRDRKAVLKFTIKSMKRYDQLEANVTENLRSYGAALKLIGNEAKQETGLWRNNRAENSHRLPGNSLIANH